MDGIIQLLNQALGLEATQLTFGQMLARGIVVYIATLAIVRLGQKRFLGRNTAFDMVLAIILGSLASRAITSTDAFFSIIGTGAALVTLHWLFAAISFRFSPFGTLVKGESRLLVKEGEIQWDAMRKSHITERELMSAVRNQINSTDLDVVHEARLERSGAITIVKVES